MTEPAPEFASFWEQATPWAAYLRPDMEQADLWRGVWEHVVLPGGAAAAFAASKIRHLLAITADWCGDAANSVPVVARLAQEVEGMELRLLQRDRPPELISRYLTNGSRSIPIVIALDQEFRELGHWGPRPAALQAWVMANKQTIPSPQRYLFARRWYAKDRGETILRELLAAGRG